MRTKRDYTVQEATELVVEEIDEADNTTVKVDSTQVKQVTNSEKFKD